MRSPFSIAVTSLLAIAAAFVLQSLNSEDQLTFQGFEKAEWRQTPACQPVLDETVDFSLNNFLLARAAPGGSTCASDWIPLKGNLIVVEYSALFFGVESHKGLSVELIDSNEVSLGRKTIPPDAFDQRWRTLRWQVPALADKHVRLLVHNTVPTRAKLRVRSRINNYRTSPTQQHLRSVLTTRLALPALLFCSFVLAILYVQVIWISTQSRLITGALFFLTACAVQYRQDLFFHFDEWFFLGRLFEHGPGALFVSHNEHVLPVFSLLYLLEFKLFGDSYRGWTLISLLLHSGNALLLSRLVQHLSSRFEHKKRIGGTVAFLYLISFLHGAVLQWALCQSSLLAVAFFLIAAIKSCEYMSGGRQSALLIAAISWLLSLFSFGLLFTGIVLLPLLMLLYVRSQLTQHSKCFSLRSYLAALLLPILTAALTYYLFRDGSGLSVSERPVFELSKLTDYVVMGTQFGTVARGLGVLPLPDLQSVEQLREWLRCDQLTSAQFAVLVGLLLNFGILLHAVLSKERSLRLLNWGVAQTFLWLPFLLIGLGRLRWGPEHAISLRYQALPSIGLALLMLPLLQDIISSLMKSSSNLRYGVSSTALFLFFLAQLYGGWRFQHFRHSGYLMNSFVEQLDDWADKLATHSLNPEAVKDYRAPRSKLAGLHPVSFYGQPDPLLRPPELHPSTMIELLSLWNSSSSGPGKVTTVDNPF